MTEGGEKERLFVCLRMGDHDIPFRVKGDRAVMIADFKQEMGSWHFYERRGDAWIPAGVATTIPGVEEWLSGGNPNMIAASGFVKRPMPEFPVGELYRTDGEDGVDEVITDFKLLPASPPYQTDVTNPQPGRPYLASGRCLGREFTRVVWLTDFDLEGGGESVIQGDMAAWCVINFVQFGFDPVYRSDLWERVA